MGADGVFFTLVAPLIGTVLANVMFAAAMPAVLRVRSSREIGSVNPLPFPVIAVNCAAWIGYAYASSDWFVLMANVPGMAMGIFYAQVTHTYALPTAQMVMEATLVVGSVVVALAGWVSVKAFAHSPADQATVMGSTAVAILVIYYAAPLSTFSTIVRKRDASSINLLLAAANTMNGSAWLAYGLAMGSPFIWAPNGFGALLGIVQMALKAVFRQGSAEQSAS